MKKLIFFIQIILVLFFVSIVKAADPSLTNTYCRFYPDGQAGAAVGNVTISSNCVIYGDQDGVVGGNINILPSARVTLYKTLVFSPGYSVNVQTGGIIYINTGGMMKQGEICIKDADSDGYADTKTLDKDPYGVALINPIIQIDQQVITSGSCSNLYRPRAVMNDLTIVDNDPNLATTDVTKLSTSDREMLRLGFNLNGITDAEAAPGDVQIIDKNLLVCTATGCPATTFNPLKGNLYVASNVGIGTATPNTKLQVQGAGAGGIARFTTSDYVSGTTGSGLQIETGTATGNTYTKLSAYSAGFAAWNNLILQEGGNVGIGITNPSYKLDVTGNSRVTGTLNATSTVTAPTFSGALSGNATTSTSSNYLSTNYAGGVQTNPQTYFNNTIGLKVAMTGYAGTWSDTLWINGYAGGDVPNMIALHTNRSGQPRMYLSSQANTSTSFGTAYEFITGYNIASQTVSNSDMTDGYHLNQGVLNGANVTFGEIYSNSWFRNNNAMTGLYNQATTAHFYSQSSAGWTLTGGSALPQLIFRDTHQGTIRGYVYSDGTGFGLLNSTGNWMLYSPYSNSAVTIPNGISTATGYFSSTLTTSGNIWMNNGSPTMYFRDTDGRGAMLHNNSNVFYILRGCEATNSSSWCTANGVWPFYINLDNNNANFGGAVTATSDVRLKTNIKTLPQNTLEKVKQLRGVYFNWKVDADMGNATQIGVIAQEVEKIFPELVSLGADGYKSVAYDRLGPILIEAIKEQQTEIDSLKQQVTDLNQRLINIESKLK